MLEETDTACSHREQLRGAGKTAPDRKLIAANLDDWEFDSLTTQWWKEGSDFRQVSDLQAAKHPQLQQETSKYNKTLKKDPTGQNGNQFGDLLLGRGRIINCLTC